MKRTIVISLVLTLLAGITSLQAWSGKGHMLVGYVADQHLTPEARKMCNHYLRHTLSYYGSWLDRVRYTEPYRKTHRWHASAFDAHTGKYIQQGGKAVMQIMRIPSELEKGGYRSLSDSAIIDNIKTLVHLLGDMHCPGHVGFRNDKGMDLWPARKVKGKVKTRDYFFRGRKIRHHGFWDSAPSLFHPSWRVEEFGESCDNLSKREATKIIQGTPIEWFEESAERARRSFMPHGSVFEEQPKSRQEELIEMCDNQIVRAGRRLAHILNTIFAASAK